MKVSKSTPLVMYLLKHEIAFESNGSELIIEDNNYKELVKMLSADKKRAYMIRSMQIIPEIKTEEKPKKSRKHEVFRRFVEDVPKQIKRPPAVYSNPNYKNMYL